MERILRGKAPPSPAFASGAGLARNLAELPGKEEKALEAQHKAAEVANTANDWYGLSVAYGEGGLYEKAIEVADKAIALNPRHLGAWNSRAMNLDQARRFTEALKAWTEVKELSGRGDGKRDKAAMEAVAQEVQTNPASRDAWARLARECRLAGRAVEAVSIARDAVRLNPSVAPCTIARVEELLNQEPKACTTLLEELVALDDHNSHYVHLLGVAWLKFGKFEDALVRLREACQLTPKAAAYWYALGKAHEQNANPGAARSAYERAVQLGHKKAGRALQRLTAGGRT